MILIYQAYNQLDPILQTQFSIVSLLHHLNHESDSELMIWIYTDQVEMLKKFFGQEARVQLRTVTAEQLKVWRGDIDFFHRVKIKILRDAARNSSGTLLYADGDTYFKASPISLFKKVNREVSLMHMPENVLKLGRDPLSKKLTRFVKKNQFVVRGRRLDLGPDTEVWNAGVIGLAEENKPLMEDMLNLTDQMYNLYPKHTMEQLAVSYFLGKNTQLERADDVVYHYWNQKPEYQILINSFFEKNKTLSEALKNYSSFQFPPPAPPRKSSLRKLKDQIQSRVLAFLPSAN